ncbi:hypothetical protein LOAG_16407 [Loa loa]|uniref:Uncharacterized protein n=1 Tax=Loa loa TaxID=7209 RepID=A0A1S0UP93_LOALO|nr:hypothetical protein LOAG_16407 [Loa loa]EJD76737.1 hypothetical protein LOAG_16407 [Loa loa]
MTSKRKHTSSSVRCSLPFIFPYSEHVHICNERIVTSFCYETGEIQYCRYVIPSLAIGPLAIGKTVSQVMARNKHM